MNEFLEILSRNIDEMFIGIIAGFVVAISQNNKWTFWKRVLISFLAGILMVLIYTLGQYLDIIFGT